MGPFHLSAILLTLAAIFGFISHRWMKLPGTIALFFQGLAFALLVSAVDVVAASLGAGDWLRHLIGQISLPAILLDGILSLLLYAAAVNEDLCALLKRKWTVLALATVGVVLFTGLMGLEATVVVAWNWPALAATALAVPLALAARRLYGGSEEER
nr:hypothetical protein [Azospirillum sp. 412522]